MATCVLELNDAGVTVHSGDTVLLESPGYAVVDRDGVELGARAFQTSRLKPRQTNNRFWDELSLDPLPSQLAGVRTHADLAFAHLEQIWSGVEGMDVVILAVPGSFTRQQLGVVLGVARECSVPVRGMVDAAVAACATATPGRKLIHLDIQLHRIVLTELAQGARLSRARVDETRSVGLVALREAWVNMIADTFVRTTRFDPLHGAGSEQELYDRLPGWLQVLCREPSALLELHAGGKTHSVTLRRERLLKATSGLYRAIRERISASTRPGEPVQLLLSHRLDGFPGLLDELAAVPDCEVGQLPADAVARGALRHASHIVSKDEDAIGFVTHLPWQPQALEVHAPATAAPPPEARPTHILYRSRAYRIDGTPFVIGADVPAEERGLSLRAHRAGVSRRHCSVFARDGAVLVEDHSTYGTFVNGARVSGSGPLAVGDRLGLGAPGQELELIALEEHGGA